jgi:cyclomaltodextrinase
MVQRVQSKCYGLLILLCVLVNVVPQTHAQVSWWEPENPHPGDLLTIYYNDIPGTLPDDGTGAKLHWGMNETAHGAWQRAPEGMWPEGTVPWNDNIAVQSPMMKISPGLWQVSIQTDSETQTLHYVVTNGTQWDNNNNANWDVSFVEQPEVLAADVEFVLDTRSAQFGFSPSLITTVNLAGTFNSWNRYSDTMDGPDENGVYTVTKKLNEGYYEYKFVINHEEWFSDPDNPNTNPSEYNNSIIIVVADTLPSFEVIVPEDGAVLVDTTETEVAAIIVDGDYEDGIDESTLSLTLDGEPIGFSYDPTASVLSGSAAALSFGSHLLTFDVSDHAGRAAPQTMSVFGVYPSGTGYHYLDSSGDDIGTGTYRYPDGVPEGSADLLSTHITLTETGDSLYVHIGLADITEYTAVTFILTNSIDAGLVEDILTTELSLLEWTGFGVYLPVLSPESPYCNEEMHNILYTNRDPLIGDLHVPIHADAIASDTFTFALSLSDLTDLLGTFADTWYCCVYSYVTAAGGVVTEINEETGGIDEDGEPDVYDAMFCDSPELQNRLLSNYTSSRQAVLDYQGRGYVGISPSDIDSSLKGSDIIVSFLTRGGTTLKRNVDVVGSIEGGAVTEATLFHNETSTVVPVIEGEFTYSAFLTGGENVFRALVVSEGDSIYSPNLVFFRKFYREPNIVFSPAVFSTGTITLNASLSTDPNGPRVFYQWIVDPDNPSAVTLDDPTSATPSFPKPEVEGEYYFDLVASDIDSDQSYGRTFVTVTADSAWGGSLNDNPQWVKDAILYEIYIRSFSSSRDFAGATARLSEVKDLGATAIWLMPINEGPSDHGYQVNDYLSIEADYGTMDDFKTFIETAHDLGLRVIIDHVVNHSSNDHPFFQDMVRFREYSFYYNFYERREELGGTLDPSGLYTYYYDWTSLPNLNQSDEDARDYFINMAKFYTDSLDVDGFRCDVAWGIQDRYPDYWAEWRQELKTTKPDILCLAEASATDHVYFDQRFDSAYDWPLFWDGFQNILSSGAVGYLHEKIINKFSGVIYGFPSNAYPLRFLENHDEQRLMSKYTLPEAKILAALNLTIPGMPLIYAGQEVGESSQRGLINWSDPYGLLPYYQKLISLRKTYGALRNQTIDRLSNGNSTFVYSFFRREGDEIVVVNLNFASENRNADVVLPLEDWNIDQQKQYFLTDKLNDVPYSLVGADLDTVHLELQPYQAQVLVLSDSPDPDFSTKGDVNGDLSINVIDVIRVVNIILELPPEATEYELWAADFNEDGVVNVLDVVEIVNEILTSP